jgi:predicted O-methyltransferase YrrM
MDFQKLNNLLNEVMAGQHDHRFEEVVNSIHCMSRPRVYAVLNACVSSMDPGETYLEVGTYQGGSAVSALLGNEARGIVVDSFEEFTQTNNFDITQGNLRRFGVDERAVLYDMDFNSFFRTKTPDFKVQVYYYDGAHGYEVQLAGMEAAWKYLADNALILVDDYTYPEVLRAINQFIANHKNEVKVQFVVNVPENNDKIWWNGCVVLKKI